MIKPFEKPIYVTKPFMPPIEEYYEGLKEVWGNQILTNDGPLLNRFTDQLSHYFETDNICLFTNGMLALQIGLQGMEIAGEVITTPFSFVATTHALYWNKLRPVFVDIEPDYYTLDPQKVEAAITPWTTAILAVHVFGHPCNIRALADIARKHNLKLIFDAAHAFGVKIGNTSISHFGDMSMYSFHATKLFQSLEGGMLTFKESGLKSIFNYLKNFGFKGQTEVVMPGTNAKMNELQALMGSLNLAHFSKQIKKRKLIIDLYNERLMSITGIRLNPKLPDDVVYNYSYMPVQIYEDEFGISRDALFEKLMEFNIYARRYFYPLINDFSCYKSINVNDPLITAKQVSQRILTLPIYFDLKLDDVNKICDIIIDIQARAK